MQAERLACPFCGSTRAPAVRAKVASDALAGLVGWAQLILAASDMPADLRSRFANNHRLTTAVIALADAEEDE